MKILPSSFLLGMQFASAEIIGGPPQENKVKLLVKYTNSFGKFSTTAVSERSINPFDHDFVEHAENVVDRIASSAIPISVKGRISQVEVEGDVEGAIEALMADDDVDEVELVRCHLMP
jgi:hypothetical protein